VRSVVIGWVSRSDERKVSQSGEGVDVTLLSGTLYFYVQVNTKCFSLNEDVVYF
jgi:hypothetical protein